MVQFHEHIITDLLEDPSGGLVILSAGLGLHKLISSLLHLHDPSQGTLLILSTSPAQKNSIKALISTQTLTEITSDLPSHHRFALYSSGGIIFITSRILIVDLLSGRVPVSTLAGIILLNAHSLSDTSTEAFIVRILRTSRSIYVRAFSDKPNAMVSGFAKAERTLKCLFLRKMHLWPRFQVYVSQDLERDPPDVVDIRVPMTSNMVGIQKAVIEVMDACLKEMKKTNKVDIEDLTVENGLFKSFDEIVRRQLDPIWHNLGKKTKQLVSDLKTLRKLLDYLVRYDAVTYLKYLDSLRASESFRSVWIFAESSFKIFELAKKRVYQVGRSDSRTSNLKGKNLKNKKRNIDESSEDKQDTNGNVVLAEVLEEAPKWKVLREILEEIEEEKEKSREEGFEGEADDNNGIVLVVCKDERSCMQLEEFITNGPRKVMREEWESYLLSKVELKALPKQNKNKKKKSTPKGFGILDGVVHSSPGKSAEASSANSQENDALVAAAAQISKQAQKGIIEVEENPKQGKGKGKMKQLSTNVQISPTKGGKGVENVNENMKPVPPVQFYALESDEHILDTFKPSTIIVYHPDMGFVREIEIYKSENPLKMVKVYFLFYEESTEVQKFEASIRRENGAFETLIRQKSLMMLPVDQEDLTLGASSSTEFQSLASQNLITRKAGGRKEAEKEMQVIVDMREFMSSLPNVLHQKGMRIIPVTLEVGDYILSPSICVERKSILDLFGSFASGRLYHQVEMMVRYYRMPVLLIEFSQDKSFSFFSASEIGDDVTQNSIISKLSLLVLHFPRLRIVWSRSLHATAEIFATLKANQDEPDEVKATRVGVPSEEGIVEDDVRAENYNTSAVEFLRRLPGVTDSNYRAIMEGCTSLAELATLPIDKLSQLLGGQKSAQILRDFLDAKYPTLL